MYTISGWRKLPNGNVHVEVVLGTLKRIKLMIHPREATPETVKAMVDNIMKSLKFNGELK